MVRFHALSLFRDGALARVLWRRRAVAADHARRLRWGLFPAAAGRDRLRPYRRQVRTAADDAFVRCPDARRYAPPRPAPNRCPTRTRRRLAPLPPALRDGLLGGRRIY